jgi:hypothetical protein
MLHIVPPLQVSPEEDLRDSMMVDSANPTDDSMVQFLMNDTLQWDMLPQ